MGLFVFVAVYSLHFPVMTLLSILLTELDKSYVPLLVLIIIGSSRLRSRWMVLSETLNISFNVRVSVAPDRWNSMMIEIIREPIVWRSRILSPANLCSISRMLSVLSHCLNRADWTKWQKSPWVKSSTFAWQTVDSLIWFRSVGVILLSLVK